MKQILFKGFLIAAAFFAVFYLLGRINWTSILKTEGTGAQMESKLGDFLWENIRKTEKVITSDSILLPLDTLLNSICKKNDINRSNISLHIIEKEEVNAFAFPGQHLVIYSGLIKSCRNEAELSGVICHELAHIEKKHVTKKLVKEIGLAALFSMANGGAGQEAVREIMKLLSSTAYDRELEREADLTAVDYLVKTGIPAEPFAEFLYRLSAEDAKSTQFYWITTHPGAKERSAYILNSLKGKKTGKTKLLTADSWKNLQSIN